MSCPLDPTPHEGVPRCARVGLPLGQHEPRRTAPDDAVEGRKHVAGSYARREQQLIGHVVLAERKFIDSGRVSQSASERCHSRPLGLVPPRAAGQQLMGKCRLGKRQDLTNVR
jgi:hypothetical protein